MSAVLERDLATAAATHSPGVWAAAWSRLKQDPVGLGALGVVLAFFLLIVSSAIGLTAKDWQLEKGIPYAFPRFIGERENIEAQSMADVSLAKDRAPLDISDVDPLAPKYKEWSDRTAKLSLVEPQRLPTLLAGGDRWGRDVLAKAIKGSQVSIFVGVFAALVATLIGTVFGALSGYFGRWVNDGLEWVYNVFTAIPPILLIFAFAAVFGRGIYTVILILGLTGWTGTYRLVRAEYLKHVSREYVRAAQAIGASHASRIFIHILPNVSHVVLVQLSLLVVAFIKAEVILSFLGLGVPIEMVSWGTMLGEAQNELIIGKWWQLGAATVFMTVFV
ncbi:MAG TPA: ABC transporter permease, partial [Burkholderiales bacterium]|nr:ABC transporter permease [Burkholderiales bacterium]